MPYVSYPEAIKLILLHIGMHRLTTTPGADIGGADVGVKASLSQIVVGCVTSLATANVPLCDAAGNPIDSAGNVIVDGVGVQATGNFAANVLGPLADQASAYASEVGTNISDLFSGSVGADPWADTYDQIGELTQYQRDALYYCIEHPDFIVENTAKSLGIITDDIEVTSVLNNIKDSVNGAYTYTIDAAKSFTNNLSGITIPGTDGFTIKNAIDSVNDSVIPSINSAASKVLPQFDIKDLCGVISSNSIPNVQQAQQVLLDKLKDPKATLPEIQAAHADLDSKIMVLQNEVDTQKANYATLNNINDGIQKHFDAASDYNTIAASGLTLPDANGNPIPVADVYKSTLATPGVTINVANALNVKAKLDSAASTGATTA